ncbi:MAG: Rpn family recombination-promoting nuclease/putative transposase [Planctomycetota bacterium]
MVPLGIRPTNDFAFLKTFGSPENKIALMSLLNAILDLPDPIVDVVIENPFNARDFMDDKLSVLDIRASDQRGWVYDIEMQVSVYSGLIQRLVYYGCEVYAGQLRSGDDYSILKPIYTICLLEGRLWQNSTKVHHAFRLTDVESGRMLAETIEIHTLELGWYNLPQSGLATASILDRWLFWLLHAHKYDTKTLRELFPQPEFLRATKTIDRIARITKDKVMYDAREKKIRDQQWILNASRKQGLEEGRQEGRQEGIELGELFGEIRVLQKMLGMAQSTDDKLKSIERSELKSLASDLEAQLRQRLD